MKINFTLLLIVLLAVSCGPRRPGKLGAAGSAGANGANGQDGSNGTSMGVEVEDIAPGAVCASGGLLLSTYKDSNSDGFLDSAETIVKVKTICNGIQGNAGADGADGQDGTNSSVSIETLAAGLECSSGGAKISSNSSASSVTVCNGSNGQDGLAGLNGLPGSDGQDGSNGVDGQDGASVIPVKFCSSDNSNFPEYGLYIGNDLYAVYWGSTPASSSAQAFLTKLSPGSYQSTGGNNCQFTVTSAQLPTNNTPDVNLISSASLSSVLVYSNVPYDLNYQAKVVITNNGSSPIVGWVAKMDIPAGYTVTSSFSSGAVHVNVASGRVEVRDDNNMASTVINPGASVNFTLVIKKTGLTQASTLPNNFSLSNR